MKYEELLNEIEENNIKLYEYKMSDGIRGLCIGSNIVLNKELKNEREKSCILAEELGHYKTTVGDITGNSASERKQELKARAYAYDRLIGAEGIVRAWKAGSRTLEETAEYLGVTEDFLLAALEYYAGRYGSKCIEYDGCEIVFEPSLRVKNIRGK